MDIQRDRTWPQGSYVQPRAPMQFVNPETGRKMKALPGQVFWVTNPEHTQKSKCAVQFQRKGKGSICTGFLTRHVQ